MHFLNDKTDIMNSKTDILNSKTNVLNGKTKLLKSISAMYEKYVKISVYRMYPFNLRLYICLISLTLTKFIHA
jgi:hypothetical protein